jgi:hypothetical protein
LILLRQAKDGKVMKTGFIRSALTVVYVLALALPAVAGPLENHYLEAFGEQRGSALEKAVLLSSPLQAPAVRSRTPLHHALKKDWDKLEPATQKILAKYVAAPALSGYPTAGTEPAVISSGGHFKIHYTTSGTDAPNIALINHYTGLGLGSITDWVALVAERFEAAYAFTWETAGWDTTRLRTFPALPLTCT